MGFAVPDAAIPALHRDNSLVGPQMNSDRAVAIAKAAAEAHGWVWQEPLHVTPQAAVLPVRSHLMANHKKRDVARRDVRVSSTSDRGE